MLADLNDANHTSSRARAERIQTRNLQYEAHTQTQAGALDRDRPRRTHAQNLDQKYASTHLCAPKSETTLSNSPSRMCCRSGNALLSELCKNGTNACKKTIHWAERARCFAVIVLSPANTHFAVTMSMPCTDLNRQITQRAENFHAIFCSTAINCALHSNVLLPHVLLPHSAHLNPINIPHPGRKKTSDNSRFGLLHPDQKKLCEKQRVKYFKDQGLPGLNIRKAYGRRESPHSSVLRICKTPETLS